MKLRELLPLLRGWEYKPKDIDEPVTVSKGQEKSIQEFRDKIGWVLFSTGALSNPDGEIVIRYDIHEVDIRPKGLYELGLTVPNAFGTWCSKYETGPPPLYSGVFMPADPLGFEKYLHILLRAPKDADMIAYNYAHLVVVVEVTDLPEFIKSLHEVYGTDRPPKIKKLLKKK